MGRTGWPRRIPGHWAETTALTVKSRTPHYGKTDLAVARPLAGPASDANTHRLIVGLHVLLQNLYQTYTQSQRSEGPTLARTLKGLRSTLSLGLRIFVSIRSQARTIAP